MNNNFKNNACPGCDNPKCKSKIKTNSFGRIRITNFFSCQKIISFIKKYGNDKQF
jgi:hypothetical protein